MKKLLTIGLLCTVLFACKNNSTGTTKADLLVSNIDSMVKPADDFFEYANGGWIKKTPMPESESGWGIGNLVQDEIYSRLKKINEDAIKIKNDEGSISQKIGDFWQTAMDTVALDKAGTTPLNADLEKINSIKNPSDIIPIAADLHIEALAYDMTALPDSFAGPPAQTAETLLSFFGQLGHGPTTAVGFTNRRAASPGKNFCVPILMYDAFRKASCDQTVPLRLKM